MLQTTTAKLVWIDYVVLALYFAVIFAIGYYYARKEKTTAGYFLAGRDVLVGNRRPLFSNIGSEHLSARRHGRIIRSCCRSF